MCGRGACSKRNGKIQGRCEGWGNIEDITGELGMQDCVYVGGGEQALAKHARGWGNREIAGEQHCMCV